MFWELYFCRHPLQELCCSPYVPNNVQSGGGHAKVKILTGPNACGKSVYLKQVFNETFTKNMSTHGAFFTKSNHTTFRNVMPQTIPLLKYVCLATYSIICLTVKGHEQENAIQ